MRNFPLASLVRPFLPALLNRQNDHDSAIATLGVRGSSNTPTHGLFRANGFRPSATAVRRFSDHVAEQRRATDDQRGDRNRRSESASTASRYARRQSDLEARGRRKSADRRCSAPPGFHKGSPRGGYADNATTATSARPVPCTETETVGGTRSGRARHPAAGKPDRPEADATDPDQRADGDQHAQDRNHSV